MRTDTFALNFPRLNKHPSGMTGKVDTQFLLFINSTGEPCVPGVAMSRRPLHFRSIIGELFRSE